MFKDKCIVPEIDDEERRLIEDDFISDWLGDNFAAFRSIVEITTPCQDLPIYVMNADKTIYRVPIIANRPQWKYSDVMIDEDATAVYVRSWESNELGKNGHCRSRHYAPQIMKQSEVRKTDKQMKITYRELLKGPIYLRTLNKIIYMADHADTAEFPIPTNKREYVQDEYIKGAQNQGPLVVAEYRTPDDIYDQLWISVNGVPVRVNITLCADETSSLKVSYAPGCASEPLDVHRVDIKEAMSPNGFQTENTRYFVSESKNSLKTAIARYRHRKSNETRYSQEDLEKRVEEESANIRAVKDKEINELKARNAELDEMNSRYKSMLEARQQERNFAAQDRQNNVKEQVMEVQREKASADVAIQSTKASTEDWKSTATMVGAIGGILATGVAVWKKLSSGKKNISRLTTGNLGFSAGKAFGKMASSIYRAGQSIGRAVGSVVGSVVGAVGGLVGSIMSLF